MGATQSKLASDGVDGVGIDTADYSEKLNEITFKKTDGTKLGPFMIKGLNGVSIDTAVMSGGELVFTKTDGTKLGPFKVKGADGLSIKNITYDELSGKITFIMTDDTKVGGFMVRGGQGIKGDKGEKGDTGKEGEKGGKGDTGKDGVSNNQGPTGPTGLTGRPGRGLTDAKFVNGQLTFDTTDPDLKYGPFDVRGPKGDTGPPGKDSTIVTSDGIRYPGQRAEGNKDKGIFGYATDSWGNVITPNDGPVGTGNNWSVSGKDDGHIFEAYTDGSKLVNFLGPISIHGGIRYPGQRADGNKDKGIFGYATDHWGNVVTPNDGPVDTGNNWSVSGKDGPVFRAYTDGSKLVNFHGPIAGQDIIAKNDVRAPHIYAGTSLHIQGRNVLEELDDLKAHAVRKDKNYAIYNKIKNSQLRAFGGSDTPSFDTAGAGGRGEEEAMQFLEYK